MVDAAQWVSLRASLVAETDPVNDSLRFYFLGNNWKHRLEHVGAKPSYDPEGPLIL
jgi:CRISPR-associated protein Cas2